MRYSNRLRTVLGVVGLLATSVCAASPASTSPVGPQFKSEVLASLNVTDANVRSLDLMADQAGNYSFSIPIEGQDISIEMWQHSIRSPDYRVLHQIEDGSIIEAVPSPVATYRGVVSEIPGATVAASLFDDQLYGLVVLPDGSRHWVEPLSSRFEGIDPTLHAVYSQEDVIPSMGICSVAEELLVKNGAQGGVELGSGDCGGMCVAEFGADADYEFYQAMGSNTATVENVINNIMNAVSTLYENQVGITYEVTGIIVRTAEPDPYSSTNADILLPQFRNEWLNNVGSSIPHDVAQLFSGKNFDGSTIGLAWVGSVCTSNRYGIVQTTCCPSFSCRTDLSAHELGHNWGSGHHNGNNSTMNPGLVCANNFITPSRNAIIGYRNSISCLHPMPPANPPGLFSLSTPPAGATDVVLNPVLSWTAAQDASFYRVSVADNPEFTAPKINEFSTTQTQLTSLPPNFLDESTTYFWKVTAFNAAGQTSSNPVISLFTTLGDEPEPCPGDADGNNSVDLADLNLVLANFGANTDQGDVDGDGTVNLADLNLVLANFGVTCE